MIGGAFLGLEAAAVARSRGTAVTVVELSDRPLAAAVGELLAGGVASAHRARGFSLARASPSTLSSGRARSRPSGFLTRRPGPAQRDLVFWVRNRRLVAAADIGAARDLRAVWPLIERGCPVDLSRLTDPAIALRALATSPAPTH